MNVLCSVHLVRHPVGGLTWHHLQYLVGLRRMGHAVTFFEHWGWPSSCYDPVQGLMTPDPTYGLAYLRRVLQAYDLDDGWCYLAEDGTAHGMSREQLADACRDCDVYLNLSGVNWIPELEACRRRVLVDTDPVFTQIGTHGVGGPFSRYSTLFTYGENVHRPGCEMPTGNGSWLPTRQPVVLDLWAASPGDAAAPFTSVISWNGHAAHEHEGRVYGGRPLLFEPFFAFPRSTGEPMELAVSAPAAVRQRLTDGGWRLVDPGDVSRTPWTYQQYLGASRAEFSVAKHAYVVTRSGWFSDRSTSYLALGRPVVVQDTGFSDFLPCGTGILAYRTPEDAAVAVRAVHVDYADRCAAARAIVEEFFAAPRVLTDLLQRAL